MKVGDKVKFISGEPFGKVGIIRRFWLMTKPVTIFTDELKKAKHEKCFECEAEDGTIFSGFKEDLELVE